MFPKIFLYEEAKIDYHNFSWKILKNLKVDYKKYNFAVLTSKVHKEAIRNSNSRDFFSRLPSFLLCLLLL